MTFAGDRLPGGINIPNYYDIREEDGFKNVIFEDGPPPPLFKDPHFFIKKKFVKDQEMSDMMNMYEDESTQVITAGHELFGHGSGKLIYRNNKTGLCPLSI